MSSFLPSVSSASPHKHKNTPMKHFARWTLALNLGCFCALTPTVTHGEAVRYGDQAITNGGFDLDADHRDVPSGWTRDVMPAGRANVPDDPGRGAVTPDDRAGACEGSRSSDCLGNRVLRLMMADPFSS